MNDEVPPGSDAEERAAWLYAAQTDREYTESFVRRACALVTAYSRARNNGREDLAIFEVAGAFHVSLTTAESQLAQALQITARPELTAAMTEGRVGLFHVLALLDSIVGLPPAVGDQVVTEVLAKATHLPPSDVRKLGRKVAMRLDPDGAAARRKDAAARRSFTLRPADDGMALITLLVRAEQALRIAHRAELATRAQDDSGRTRDQRRADWVVDRLLEDAPGAAAGAAGGAAAVGAAAGAEPDPLDRRHRRATQIMVGVPVATALGLSNEPGTLGDYGPIDAEHARSLVSEAELRKVCVDAASGNVLHVEDTIVRPVPDPARVEALGGDPPARAQALAEAVQAALVEMVLTPSTPPAGPEPGYRPSAALSRTVKVRSVRCDMVGCSQPASLCDDDHTIPYPQGPTSLENLASRSRRCHQAKQRGWTPMAQPDGGTLWVSPCGLTYLSPSVHDPPPPIAAGARLPSPGVPEAGEPAEQPWSDPADWDLGALADALMADRPTVDRPGVDGPVLDRPAVEDPPPF